MRLPTIIAHDNMVSFLELDVDKTLDSVAVWDLSRDLRQGSVGVETHELEGVGTLLCPLMETALDIICPPDFEKELLFAGCGGVSSGGLEELGGGGGCGCGRRGGEGLVGEEEDVDVAGFVVFGIGLG